MRPADVLTRAARGALAHRSRAVLTLLGVVIGAGAIVLLAGLLRGGEDALMRTSQRASETDLLEVRRDDVPARQRHRTRRELSRTDATVLGASSALEGSSVASEASRETLAILRNKKKPVTVVSAQPGALGLYRLELQSGRFVGDSDVAERRRVCVVGHEIWSELLGSRGDLDVSIQIDGRPFSVVGVLADKPMLGSTDGTHIWNRKVIIPETTYDAIYSPGHEVRRIYVRAGADASAGRMVMLERVIRGVLLRRHFGVTNFDMDGQGERNEERLILSIIELLLQSTGLLALFVGGINIMNVMLVTVTERTREIGVRRAVGATRRQILTQFLLESAFIALSGGVIGVVLGGLLSWGAAIILEKVLGQWAFHLETWSVLLGLALSAGTGIAFGAYPAWRAARLDPIQALRFE